MGMNIGDVARRAGLPTKTVRYYDEIGLVTPGRDDNGYRAYSERDLHKLAFLGRARSLGFSIEDCRKLLALYEDRGRSSADVRAVATHHLAEIETRLTELTAMRDTLAHLVECCAGDARPDCPILSDLAEMPAGAAPDEG